MKKHNFNAGPSILPREVDRKKQLRLFLTLMVRDFR